MLPLTGYRREVRVSFECATADTQAEQNCRHEVRTGAGLGWSMLGQDSTSMTWPLRA